MSPTESVGMRFLRYAFALGALAALLWFATSYRIGRRTPAGHLQAWAQRTRPFEKALEWARRRLTARLNREPPKRKKPAAHAGETVATRRRVAILQSAARAAARPKSDDEDAPNVRVKHPPDRLVDEDEEAPPASASPSPARNLEAGPPSARASDGERKQRAATGARRRGEIENGRGVAAPAGAPEPADGSAEELREMHPARRGRAVESAAPAPSQAPARTRVDEQVSESHKKALDDLVSSRLTRP